jgi:hypothetical protein
MNSPFVSLQLFSARSAATPPARHEALFLPPPTIGGRALPLADSIQPDISPGEAVADSVGRWHFARLAARNWFQQFFPLNPVKGCESSARQLEFRFS